MSTMIRGSLKPDLQVTISDARSDADFSAVTTSMVWVICEMGGAVIVNAHPDAVNSSVDGKSAAVHRAWEVADTATAGRMWVSVKVDWPTGKSQTFPVEGALRLDITRAAGDA